MSRRTILMPRELYDATPFIPETRSLRRLSEAVEGCRGCPLYKNATHGVFGEGRASSRVLKNRGKVHTTEEGDALVVSIHPSVVLRAPDREAREASYKMLVADLKLAKKQL